MQSYAIFRLRKESLGIHDWQRSNTDLTQQSWITLTDIFSFVTVYREWTSRSGLILKIFPSACQSFLQDKKKNAVNINT